MKPAAVAAQRPDQLHGQGGAEEGMEEGDSLDAFVVETCLLPVSHNQIPDVMPQVSAMSQLVYLS